MAYEEQWFTNQYKAAIILAHRDVVGEQTIMPLCPISNGRLYVESPMTTVQTGKG